MSRPLHLLIAITAAAAIVACGDKPSPPPQTNVVPPVSSAPPPAAASTSPAIPPAPTATGVNPAETARDSAATNPRGPMSKEQESKSMPMAGQVNNYSSTALDSKEAPKK